MDNEFWRQYKAEIFKKFEGVCFSRFGNYGTRPVREHGHNSGAGALQLAADLGAHRIVMLGYDCGFNGRKHWHEDHKKPLGNCESIHRWMKQFEAVREQNMGIEILNASRSTKLNVFPLVTLERVL